MTKKAAGIRRRADGSYENRFTVNGRRCSVYGRTVQECREKEAKKRQEIAEGLYKKGRSLTVREYMERWIETKRGTVKENTLLTEKMWSRTICSAVIDRAGTAFGDLILPEVETQNVRDLQAALQKTVRTQTANNLVALARSMFKAAVNERVLSWNPAQGVRSLKRTEPAARDTVHRALTREETAAFMEAAAESWYKDLYTFLLNTGLRVGEAGALLPGDLRSGCANVNKTITRTEIGGYAIGSDTKTRSGKRVVPLNSAASAALEHQRAVNAAVFGRKIMDLSQPIFRTQCGSLLASTNVNQDVRKICRAAGIERFTVHAFRDTFATRCVESGMQPKILQDLLGHSDISMTMNLYAHSMETDRAAQLKVVNFS